MGNLSRLKSNGMPVEMMGMRVISTFFLFDFLFEIVALMIMIQSMSIVE